MGPGAAIGESEPSLRSVVLGVWSRIPWLGLAPLEDRAVREREKTKRQNRNEAEQHQILTLTSALHLAEEANNHHQWGADHESILPMICEPPPQISPEGREHEAQPTTETRSRGTTEAKLNGGNTIRICARLGKRIGTVSACLDWGVNADAEGTYNLPDPELRAFDHGIGTLHVGGELAGYLASVVGQIKFPSRQPWPWFVIVWADGTRERPFEDYGPRWYTVRELNSGYLEHFKPSLHTQKRVLGVAFHSWRRGLRCRYDFEWLPREEAAEKWTELGLTDSDF